MSLLFPQLPRQNPWDPKYEIKYDYIDSPCPPCAVPVPVACLGKHEVVKMKCSEAKVTSCHRPCGRQLTCTNHTCQLDCHTVVNAPDSHAVSVPSPYAPLLALNLPCRRVRHVHNVKNLASGSVPRAAPIPACCRATLATVRLVSR
jgi:hypothetical protein